MISTSVKRSSAASQSRLFVSSDNNPPQSNNTPTLLMKDPYYSNKAFYRFFPIAGIYTILTHLVLFLFKPLPFLLPRDMTNVNIVHEENRFVLPPPTATNCETNQNKHDGNDKTMTQIAIVTGSNTGIGFETASSLVEMGYNVILACRSTEKGLQAVNKINSSKNQKGKAIFLHPLDLSSLQSVHSFVAKFNSTYNHCNILINNAGINTTTKSKDDMDLCFQTNFVGHYLLTRLLLPKLLLAKNYLPKSDDDDDNDNKGFHIEAGRVVNLSSVTHHFASANEERRFNVQTYGKHDEEWWRGCAKPYVSGNTYKESKMAALLFTQELNRRFGSSGLRAVAANPGSVNSDIWRNYPKYMMTVHDMIYLSTKQGSSTSFAAAVGDLPQGAMYLQPYWQPWGKVTPKKKMHNKSFINWYSLPVPFTEMMGVYIGHAVTDCRLPAPEYSIDMWNVCEELVGLKKDKIM